MTTLTYTIFIFTICFNIINYNLSQAVTFIVENKCDYILPIYSHENRNFIQKCNLESNTNCSFSYNNHESGLIKTTLSEIATLFEFTINNKGIWYDISIIPPGSGICYNYDECFSISKKLGYNIPIQIKISNPSISCKNLECLSNLCNDAYLFPYDDLKTHFCTLDTNFFIIYCPDNNQQIISNLPINSNTQLLDCIS